MFGTGASKPIPGTEFAVHRTDPGSRQVVPKSRSRDIIIFQNADSEMNSCRIVPAFELGGALNSKFRYHTMRNIEERMRSE